MLLCYFNNLHYLNSICQCIFLKLLICHYTHYTHIYKLGKDTWRQIQHITQAFKIA